MLAGKVSLEDAVYKDPSTNMVFLPAVVKSRLAHSSEILASDATKRLFDQLRQGYEYVMVDLSPLAPIIDVRTTTQLVDSYVFIVEWGRTKIEVAMHALDEAEGVYENLLGAVLNKADMNVFGRYQSHRENYYYNQHYSRVWLHGINSVLSSFSTGRYIGLARIFIAGLGCAAVTWGLATWPIFWREASMEYIARHIIRGEPYQIEVLAGQMPVVEAAENSTTCRPIALWSAAIVRLRIVDEAGRNGAGKPVYAQQMKSLENSIRRSLSCSPAEPFLWLTLYWVERAQNGFKPEYLKYLRISYDLGPNEGWIILKRNPIALADFERLPADLAADAINEFVALLNNESLSGGGGNLKRAPLVGARRDPSAPCDPATAGPGDFCQGRI